MPLINLFKKSSSPRPPDEHNTSAPASTTESVTEEPSATIQTTADDITEIMSRTFMAKVWQVFTAFPLNSEGHLNRRKALVLTQHLASVMQISLAVIKDFNGHFPETQFSEGVAFEDYRTFLNNYLLTKIIIDNREDELCFENDDQDANSGGSGSNSSNASAEVPKQPIAWEFLDQVCWTLFSKQALSPRYFEQLSEDTLYTLWLWYTTFADTDEAGIVVCPVVMDSEELNHWLHYLFGELLALEMQPLKFLTEISLTFTEVLDAILAMKEEWSIDKEELEFVINEFRMEIIDGVMRRGFLHKGKRNLMKSQWKRRYCVLNLRTFSYYTDENMTEKKGQIPLSQVLSADPYRDRNSKLTRYQLETKAALFILEAEDLRSRNQWIRDIRFAIRCSQKMIDNVHIGSAEKRKKERQERRQKEREIEEEKKMYNERIMKAEEENLELSKQIKDVKIELQREEQQRQAEEKAREQITKDLQARLETVTAEMNSTMEDITREKEEQQQELENERTRVAELQTMREELQAALQEEQQLRKDEETVMRMQAELMEEHIRARERLEEMKSEQDQLLDMEIQKRANIQMELENQKETIAQTEVQLEQYVHQLKESEQQKTELYKKMESLEHSMKLSAPIMLASHRGKGAFPTTFFSKKEFK